MIYKCDHSVTQILCSWIKKTTSCMVVVFCYKGIWNVSWYASFCKDHWVICDFELLWYVKNVVFEIDISYQNPIYCQCPLSFLFLVTKLKFLVDKSDSVWGFLFVTTQLNVFALVERHMQFAIICHFSCLSMYVVFVQIIYFCYCGVIHEAKWTTLCPFLVYFSSVKKECANMLFHTTREEHCVCMCVCVCVRMCACALERMYVCACA